MLYRVTEQRMILISFDVEAESPEQAEQLFYESSEKLTNHAEEVLDSHGLTVRAL